jgi:hypothetical protein
MQQRGFNNPPVGAIDDPKTQSGYLWAMLRVNPIQVALLIRGAPIGTFADVVRHAFREWNAIYRAVPDVHDATLRARVRNPRAQREAVAEAVVEGLASNGGLPVWDSRYDGAAAVARLLGARVERGGMWTSGLPCARKWPRGRRLRPVA